MAGQPAIRLEDALLRARCREIGPVETVSQNNVRGPPNAKVSGKPDGGPGGTRLAVRTRTVTLQLAPNGVPVRVSEGRQGKSREPGPGVRLVRFTVLLGGPVPGLAAPIALFGAMQ